MLKAIGPPDPDRLFAAIDLDISPIILVAVSGGSDSMALLDLAARVVPAGRLVAATVDHGLRPGSAGEADGVARFCEDRGIRHLTLRWDGAKPASGLQAAARAARYRLLGEAALTLGATILLAGHTADDQAETVAMRSARGPGRGLAGMARATLLDGRLWVVRPLLDLRRAALRDHLRGNGIGWTDDPSNENEAFERVRTRRALGDPEAVDALLALARSAAAERLALGEAAARLIATSEQPSPGLLRVPVAGLREAPAPEAAYALRLLLAASGGTPRLTDGDRALALLARLDEPGLRASLSRCTVERRGGFVYLRRESRSLPQPGPLEDGALWDGRFRMSGARRPIVAALGKDRGGALADGACDAPPALVRAALATSPMIVAADGADPPACQAGADPAASSSPREASASHRLIPVAAPFAAILPEFDLAPAAALARLVGAELPPPSPYARHIPARP